MTSGKVFGVVAIIGTMLAADAQAARGDGRGRGGGRAAFRGGGGGFARVKAPAFRGTRFRGGRSFAQQRFASRRFSRAAVRPVGYRNRGFYARPARGIYRGGYRRPLAVRQAAFRGRGAYARPVRGIYRGGYARRAAFRRGAIVQQRRLAALQRANWRRNVAWRNREEWRDRREEWLDRRRERWEDAREEWRDRRRDWRRAYYRPYYYGGYYPANYYAASYYYPTTYSTAVVPRVSYGLVGNSTVSAVQTQLARLGYYDGPIDGVMGPMTRRAIVAFERDSGLPRYTRITTPLLVSLGLA